MRDGWKVIGAFLFLIGFVVLMILAGNYNHESQKTCESVGYTMVKVYKTGEYGCASVVSFEEVAGR